MPPKFDPNAVVEVRKARERKLAVARNGGAVRQPRPIAARLAYKFLRCPSAGVREGDWW